TDPDAIAATFAWAAGRAREGAGPALIELCAMRMCGHAHHDDMLYLGRDPGPSWDYPTPSEAGYADREAYPFGAKRDPIPTYGERLRADGVIGPDALAVWKREADSLVEVEARAVIELPWPDPGGAGASVVAGEAPRAHGEPLADPAARLRRPRP